MKKIALSLTGLLVAVAFAPETFALPVFARQTGMACRACHFQHFPALNGFGRAFKASGYTMMGIQGKVEDEHLSIPNTLNLGALTTTGYETQSNRGVGIPDGSYNFPADGGELSLFFGGRVSDNVGFLSELALTGTGVGPANTNAAKLPILFEVGDSGTRIGIVPMATAGQGAAHSFELLNTGAAATHRIAAVAGPGGEHINANSAAQYLGTKTAANGFSFVAVNPGYGFLNIGTYGISAIAIGGPLASSGANGMNSTYVRVAGMFDAGGWDSAAGIQDFSGKDAANAIDTKATIIDAQMQGEAGGKPLGVYASYGRAPSTVATNLFNPGTLTRKSFNMAAELGVIPHKATVQLAFRSGNSGAPPFVGASDTDNAIMLGGTYELAQNVELSLTHTAQSGGTWNVAPEPPGKTATSFMLEALF